jgi:hypothetical protein
MTRWSATMGWANDRVWSSGENLQSLTRSVQPQADGGGIFAARLKGADHTAFGAKDRRPGDGGTSRKTHRPRAIVPRRAPGRGKGFYRFFRTGLCPGLIGRGTGGEYTGGRIGMVFGRGLPRQTGELATSAAHKG